MYINQWYFITIVFIMLLVTYHIGFLFGNRKPVKETGHSVRVSNIQAGIMSLLGVMLAFSFSLSSERYEQRRRLIIEESMNIGTAYFRAGLLPDSLRHDLRGLLKSYLDERINFYKTGNTQEEMEQIQSRAQEIQVQIWAKTAVIGKNAPNLNTNINILSLNTMIDISGNISSIFQSHVPKMIILLLTFITTCTVLIIGYSHGLSSDKNFPFMIILNIILCSILLLILDLDTPTSGFLRADIYSLRELKKSIIKYNSAAQ